MTLSQIIQLRTGDGLTIVDFLLDVMHDRYQDFQICHRLQAAKLLTTYGNEDAPNFIDDNTREPQSNRNGRRPRRPTKFDEELARVIREDTDDGRSIARFLVNVMVGEFASFRPHHRMSAARELLDRGFGKSARADKAVRPESVGADPLVRPELVEGPAHTNHHFRENGNPEAGETLTPHSSPLTPGSPELVEADPLVRPELVEGPTHTNHYSLENDNPGAGETLTPHSSPLTPRNAVADDTDYWLDIYDSPLYEFMCECEHPDFDPFLAAIDEEYFQSFTGCTDPECEVHGDPPDFDPNDHHY